MGDVGHTAEPLCTPQFPHLQAENQPHQITVRSKWDETSTECKTARGVHVRGSAYAPIIIPVLVIVIAAGIIITIPYPLPCLAVEPTALGMKIT